MRTTLRFSSNFRRHSSLARHRAPGSEKVGMLYMNSTMAYGNDTIHGKAGDFPSTSGEAADTGTL